LGHGALRRRRMARPSPLRDTATGHCYCAAGPACRQAGKHPAPPTASTTHASLLLAAGGEPPRSSPSRLGHSSVAFTLDTSAHVMPGMQPEAAELFRQLVFEEEIQGRDRRLRRPAAR
jgi:hypothetical protein